MTRLTTLTTQARLQHTINSVIQANPGLVSDIAELLDSAGQCIGTDALNDDLRSQFDFENVLTKTDVPPTHPLYTLMGPIALKHVTAQGFLVGQDYGIPFYIIVYIDDTNELRGYVPQSGNAINPYTGQLFGEGDPQDDVIAQHLGHADYASMDYSLPHIQDQFYDKTMLIHDITTTIQLKP